jgi:hypothetical protein
MDTEYTQSGPLLRDANAPATAQPTTRGTGTIAFRYLLTAVMSVFYAGMAILVFIVTHHPALQNDEYKVSVWYVVQSFIFYFIVSALWTGSRAGALWARLLNPRVSGIIGAAWAINYVCILMAGPYMPNALQAIFSQMQVQYTVKSRFKSCCARRLK